MGKKLHLILAFTCALCFTTGVFAQDADKAKEAKMSKKEKGKKGGKNKYYARILSDLGNVELTKEQKTNLKGLVDAKREDLMSLQKQMGELVGKDNVKTIMKSVRKSVKDGKPKAEALKMAWTEAGVSAEDQAAVAALDEQRQGIYKEIKDEMMSTFTDEQKTAMASSSSKKSGKGKGKGKKDKKGKGKKDKKGKGKKKTEGDLTSVSVSLPGMT